MLHSHYITLTQDDFETLKKSSLRNSLYLKCRAFFVKVSSVLGEVGAEITPLKVILKKLLKESGHVEIEMPGVFESRSDFKLPNVIDFVEMLCYRRKLKLRRYRDEEEMGEDF
jgi:hypothetical protein